MAQTWEETRAILEQLEQIYHGEGDTELVVAMKQGAADIMGQLAQSQTNIKAVIRGNGQCVGEAPRPRPGPAHPPTPPSPLTPSPPLPTA